MDAPSTFATAARRCFTAPEIVELLSTNSPLSLSSVPPPSPPSSGSLFLYDRSSTRSYKRDRHEWVKKPVSQKRGTFRVREDFVRLRHRGQYRVAAFYARSETGRGAMRRRCYHLIDPVSLKPENDLVLVHYLSDAVCQKFDGPIRDSSTAGHEAETERTPLACAVRSVTNTDEQSVSALGLAEHERKEATGKRKISTTADGTGRVDDKIACYKVDANGISAHNASLHGLGNSPAAGILLGQSPNTSMLQNTLALATSSAQNTTPSTVSQLLASPKVSEEDVMNEWLSYSEMEKHAVISDIYGTAVCAEDQNDASREVLTWKISLMNEEISKIPICEKVCYLEALRQCPNYALGFRLQFLQSENFCPLDAAHRLVRYWTKRVEIFGLDFAFVPSTLEGTMANYYKDPSFGRVKLLPEVDSSGRGILLIDNTIPCTKETAIRSMWYMAHAAMEDDRVKRNGYVGIVNRFSPPEEFSRQGKMEQLHLVRDILPLRCRALHVCNWNGGEMCNWFVKAVVAALNFTAGPFFRSRIAFHDGSNEEVILQLAEYGISRNQLPTTMGGTFTEEAFLKWLALRVEAKL